jgi:hypothetical protein
MEHFQSKSPKRFEFLVLREVIKDVLARDMPKQVVQNNYII